MDKKNKDITSKEAGNIVRDMIQTIEDKMADDEVKNIEHKEDKEKSS